MKVDDIIIKGFGYWLLAIVNSIIVFVSYFIGHAANGLDPMFVSLILTILMATEMLLVLVIKFKFQLPEDEE